MYDYSTYNSYMGLTNNNVGNPFWGNSTNSLNRRNGIGTIPGINAPKKNDKGKKVAGVLLGLAAATAAVIVGIKAKKSGGISKIFTNAKKAFTSKATQNAATDVAENVVSSGSAATKQGFFKRTGNAVKNFFSTKFSSKAATQASGVAQDATQEVASKVANEAADVAKGATEVAGSKLNVVSQVADDAVETVTQKVSSGVSENDQSVIRYFHKDIDSDAEKYAEEIKKANEAVAKKTTKAAEVAQDATPVVIPKVVADVLPSEANKIAQENLAKMQEAVAAQQKAIAEATKPLDEMQAKAEEILKANTQK